MKTKPMYVFMNMLFQQTIEQASREPTPTQGGFVPRDGSADHRSTLSLITITHDHVHLERRDAD